MAIKAGQIIHDAYGFVIDRLQSAGVNSLSINEEKVYELGNFESVASVRDAPDLTFDVESTDAGVEFEALMTFVDPLTVPDGAEFDLNDCKSMDIISPIKAGKGIFTTYGGVIIPGLVLEQSTWRGGIRQNHTQSHTFRGDSYFYVDGPGAPYYEEFDGDGATDTFAFEHEAKEYNYGGDTVHAVGVSTVFADGTERRLFFGDHYTDTANDFTLNDPALDAPVGSVIRVVYGSDEVAEYPQSVHEGTDIKPAALRHADIDIYVGDSAATPTLSLWNGVQSFELTRRLTLEKDEEFGNPRAVSQDYDVPEVSGTFTVRPVDLENLYAKVYAIANVARGELAGPLTSVPVPVEIRMTDPNSGLRTKTFYVPDARFQLPPINARVQQKQDIPFPFSSDSGQVLIYKGNRFGT